MSVSNIRRLRFAPAPADLYTDPVAGFQTAQAEAMEVSTGIKMYPREFLSLDGAPIQSAVGEREAGIKLTLDARGNGIQAPGNVAATPGEAGLLLRSVFGREVLGHGGSVTAASTSSVTVADASNIPAGSVVGLVGPDGKFHARCVDSKAGNILSFLVPLPFTPEVGSHLYAGAAYSHAIDGHQHVWFDVEAYTSGATGARYYVRGCLGGFSLKGTSARGKVSMEFDFKGLDWSDEGAGTPQPATALPGGLPTSGTFARSCRVYVCGLDGARVASFEYALGNEIGAVDSVGSKNGISKFFVKDAKQTLKLVSLWDDAGSTLESFWKSGQPTSILIEMTGGGPGNSFAIYAPRVEIVGVKPVSLGGLDGREADLRVIDGSITGSAVASLVFAIL